MRKRIFAILTVLGLSLGVVAATPSAASASWSECPSSHLCFWDNDNGGSPKIVDLSGWIWGFEQHFAGDSSTYGCYNFPSAANDRANSVWNNYPAGHHVVVFSGYNCVSDIPEGCNSNYRVVQPGVKVGDLISAFWYCGLRDEVSSVRIRWY